MLTYLIESVALLRYADPAVYDLESEEDMNERDT